MAYTPRLRTRARPEVKPPINIEYEPTPFQYELLDAFNGEHKHIYLTSQVGNGKSFGLCALIIIKCLQYPGIRVGLARQTLALLKKTTLVSFFEVLDKWKLTERVKYSEQNSHIIFDNGSIVSLIDLEHYTTDPEYLRLNGLLLTFAVVDEAGQLKNNKGVNILFSRCGRWKNKQYSIPSKIFYALNPTNNYIRDLYVLHKSGTPAKGHYFIEAKIDDNKFLPSDYYDSLRETLSARDIKRLIEDDWFYDNNPNSIFNIKDLPKMLSNTNYQDGDRYLSCDIAMTSDKFVLILWKGFNVEKIFVYGNKDGEEIVDTIKNICTQYDVPSTNVVFDADGVGLYLKGFLSYGKGINNNARPLNNENYTNLKAQLYLTAADYVNKGKVRISDDTYFDDLRKELEVVELLESNGKIGITPKSEVKRIIGHSPDISDAFVYRFLFAIKSTGKSVSVGNIFNKKESSYYD